MVCDDEPRAGAGGRHTCSEAGSAGVGNTFDPWDTPYYRTCITDAETIRVVSAGPDQRFGTSDDITSDRD